MCHAGAVNGGLRRGTPRRLAFGAGFTVTAGFRKKRERVRKVRSNLRGISAVFLIKVGFLSLLIMSLFYCRVAALEKKKKEKQVSMLWLPLRSLRTR